MGNSCGELTIPNEVRELVPHSGLTYLSPGCLPGANQTGFKTGADLGPAAFPPVSELVEP